MKKKPIILTFVPYYLPGYKSGGPVRTIANMIKYLGDEFDYRIVTLDRDVLDKEPYPGVEVNAWNFLGNTQVYYASMDSLTLKKISKLIQESPHDVLYLNSFFSTKFTLLPLLARRFGLLPKRPIVLAPRGEFSAGALALKSWKKRPYIWVTNKLSLYREITWQASSECEVNDIRRHLGKNIQQIVVARNLPYTVFTESVLPIRKPKEPLKIVFLSRITPIKNLDYALRVLGRVSVPVLFNIYGPIRDERYWESCQYLIKCLPAHVKARFHGAVLPTQVPKIMRNHDLFFLPTLGENYGHVIAEAFSAGTPVLIANTTPWRGLAETGCGWDLDLANVEGFVKCIEHYAQISMKEYLALRSRV